MRVIAIQRGLDEIREILNQKGYRTIYTDEVREPVYACIYYEESNHHSYDLINQHLNNGFMSSTAMVNQGVLLINSKLKQPQEIISILEKRTYSPLF